MSMTEGQEPEVEAAHVPIGEDELTEPAKAPAKAKTKLGKYVTFPWHRGGRQRLNLAWRAAKMLVPTCGPCQEAQLPGWWLTCPHNPYFHTNREDVVTPVIMCDNCIVRVPDGALECSKCHQQNYIQDGTETKPSFTIRPNLREVRIDTTSNSGNSFNHSKSKGWILPQDKGIAPYCEFSRCYEQNPQIRTEYGSYCCSEEAKLVVLFADQEAVEIFDMRKRRQQLRATGVA